MGWEKRAGRSYYYQARKVNGKVVKTYLGANHLAAALAAFDTLDRIERRADADEWRDQQQRLDELDHQLDHISRLTDSLVSATLLLAGYHRPNRGQWRKKRD